MTDFFQSYHEKTTEINPSVFIVTVKQSYLGCAERCFSFVVFEQRNTPQNPRITKHYSSVVDVNPFSLHCQRVISQSWKSFNKSSEICRSLFFWHEANETI